jgi:DMSO/TMAO reductase YedYZ molybdopterin-dependent catalytic subunit
LSSVLPRLAATAHCEKLDIASRAASISSESLGVDMPVDGKRGMIVRQKAPLNLETPFSHVSDTIVGVDEFFVRNHFPMPVLQAETWRLRIGGAVKEPLSLSLADLAALPQTAFQAVVECAGNGRVYYEPVRPGLQWQNGAVGNALWSGVKLADVVAEAGLSSGALEAVFSGADQGIVDAGQKTVSPGPIAFARSVPLAKALSGDVLLATHMNGEPLTQEHGFPCRAVVAGWYGMAWVKWLSDIRIVEAPFSGYWQARDYFRWSRDMGEPRLVPLAEMEVKCQIAQPIQGARLPLGRMAKITGMAWGGQGGIRAVDISVNEGSWQRALLTTPESAHGWRRFEWTWLPDAAGPASVRARATDAAGNTQPDSQQPDRESYLANWIVPVGVTVVDRLDASDAGYSI